MRGITMEQGRPAWGPGEQSQQLQCQFIALIALLHFLLFDMHHIIADGEKSLKSGGEAFSPEWLDTESACRI